MIVPLSEHHKQRNWKCWAFIHLPCPLMYCSFAQKSYGYDGLVGATLHNHRTFGQKDSTLGGGAWELHECSAFSVPLPLQRYRAMLCTSDLHCAAWCTRGTWLGGLWKVGVGPRVVIFGGSQNDIVNLDFLYYMKIAGLTSTSQKHRSPLCTMVHNAGGWCTTQVSGGQHNSVLLKWCHKPRHTDRTDSIT